MSRAKLLLCVLAACGGQRDQTAPPSSASSPTGTPGDASAAVPAVDASPWVLGERPVEKTAANDSPVMCMEPSVCSSKCDQGDGAGCYWLGVMYVTKSDVSMGVPFDPQKGLNLFLVSCDLGITLGCNGAAQLFRMGSMDLPVDLPRAGRLFQKACDMGMEAACRNANVDKTK